MKEKGGEGGRGGREEREGGEEVREGRKGGREEREASHEITLLGLRDSVIGSHMKTVWISLCICSSHEQHKTDTAC